MIILCTWTAVVIRRERQNWIPKKELVLKETEERSPKQSDNIFMNKAQNVVQWAMEQK